MAVHFPATICSNTPSNITFTLHVYKRTFVSTLNICKLETAELFSPDNRTFSKPVFGNRNWIFFNQTLTYFQPCLQPQNGVLLMRCPNVSSHVWGNQIGYFYRDVGAFPAVFVVTKKQVLNLKKGENVTEKKYQTATYPWFALATWLTDDSWLDLTTCAI